MNGGRRHRRGRRRCTGADYSGRWHGSPEKKTKGGSSPEGRQRRGGLLDINGEARGGRGSDADDHSG